VKTLVLWFTITQSKGYALVGEEHILDGKTSIEAPFPEQGTLGIFQMEMVCAQRIISFEKTTDTQMFTVTTDRRDNYFIRTYYFR
jgi:hypothetical protein